MVNKEDAAKSVKPQHVKTVKKKTGPSPKLRPCLSTRMSPRRVCGAYALTRRAQWCTHSALALTMGSAGAAFKVGASLDIFGNFVGAEVKEAKRRQTSSLPQLLKAAPAIPSKGRSPCAAHYSFD
jgi:hypothetical protein